MTQEHTLTRLGVLALASGLVAAPASAQAVAWTQRAVTGPSPRTAHAMAFDSARGVTVLFGGLALPCCSNSYADTWEWDGTVWVQRQVIGPSTRFGHAMAYDSARGVSVLFGGYGVPGDTWEWDGATWAQRQVSGPNARAYPRLAYDSGSGTSVLFGGRYLIGSSTYFYGDTWEWNGASWTQRQVSGPSARIATSMVYDSARGRTVLFGGSYNTPNGSQYFYYGDTWQWDRAAWTQHTWQMGDPNTPGGVMAYDPDRGVTVMFTLTPSQTGGTYEWDGTVWSQRQISGPSPRVAQAMVYDSTRRAIVLFGGTDTSSGGALGDTWELATCYPNCDNSIAAPVLNVLDFGCFLNRFAAGDSYANCDNSTTPPVLNVLDFSCFLNAFAAGCP